MQHHPPLEQQEQIPFLLDRICQLRKQAGHGQRVLIAVAGGPGSGKSTLCARLLRHAEESGLHDVVAVPMDGFHYPKSCLAAFEDPAEAFARRGAPFTFDARRFIEAVARLRSDKSALTLPGFDHAAKDPVEDGISVASSDKVVLLEGNYVLLGEEPWDQIAEMVDERWYVDVPREVAKARLIERHLRASIEKSPLAAAARAESNDLQNADYILSRLIQPDVVIQSC
ncbi:Putative phosphoribulokinase/uridine kinase, P-loop containing nucleoside triphosphate hydrolase [Septoria linicola]|uniref:Phosphoribulokinase/uridine kinase, P-loop containing nucleoside triphosphate hydrolase n=1 Tax=Septoria linicola TaxID=215465 RepID=A0A9Q9B7U9_9PEZI|nr:putative phosphoribulokinase/uridine kinase, P-loop containing nucleoside triphosphate hydrolase [Septoria linicola]USW58671.1 Putative phosphoribulokinase/uridine kinase, P-loop containing nucleoside triphosphate hydrolase [Septoria linicola]